MKDQSCSVVPISPGIMKEQSPTVSPKTNVIWDKSYSLATEKGFTLQKLLGEGAFGKVMLASHPSTSMILAVKIIENKIKVYPEARLLKEVRNNLFITHLYDSFQSEVSHFIFLFLYLFPVLHSPTDPDPLKLFCKWCPFLGIKYNINVMQLTSFFLFFHTGPTCSCHGISERRGSLWTDRAFSSTSWGHHKVSTKTGLRWVWLTTEDRQWHSQALPTQPRLSIHLWSIAVVSKLWPWGQMWPFACLYAALGALFLLLLSLIHKIGFSADKA